MEIPKAADLQVFAISGPEQFRSLALQVFRFQYHNNPVYRQYCNLLKTQPEAVSSVEQIPFLPIGCFKTHVVATTVYDPRIIFESSGTTPTGTSRHLVNAVDIYRKSFIDAFELFYGDVDEWCIIGLLPSYLERKNSSLVMMVNDLIELSENVNSGFYLYDHVKLAQVITENEAVGQKTLLIGVTFALLDFAETFRTPLKHTVVMETGGMKGRRKEITRLEVHDVLCATWRLDAIHSEYGMTELLSQAYSAGKGLFRCPPWMKVILRDEDDPLTIKTVSGEKPENGLINVIDLANIYSCSFIATDDIGKLYADDSFEVIGRMDTSDVRGCSLMYNM